MTAGTGRLGAWTSELQQLERGGNLPAALFELCAVTPGKRPPESPPGPARRSSIAGLRVAFVMLRQSPPARAAFGRHRL